MHRRTRHFLVSLIREVISVMVAIALLQAMTSCGRMVRVSTEHYYYIQGKKVLEFKKDSVYVYEKDSFRN